MKEAGDYFEQAALAIENRIKYECIRIGLLC